MKNIALLIAICLICNACSKEDCRNPKPIFQFNGFDSTELSLIYVKTYKKGSGFTDPSNIYMSGCYINYDHGDTLSLGSAARLLYSGVDVSVYIPATLNYYWFRDIAITGRSQSGHAAIHEVCSNTVSYYLNDTLHTQTAIPNNGNEANPICVMLNR